MEPALEDHRRKDEEEANRLTFFAELCLKGAKDLKKVLEIGNQHHKRVHHRATSAPRDYYLYSAINEVEKAGSVIMRLEGFLDGDDTEPESEADENILQAVNEELLLRIRKLTEILCELILFSQTNEDPYYKHYMLVKELKSLQGTIENAKIAYGCEIQNYKKQLVDAEANVSMLETKAVDVAKCWYLKKNTSRAGVESRTPGSKGYLSSFQDRFNDAFQLADANQTISLGVSFEEGYGGQLSTAAHFNAISMRFEDISLEALRKSASHIGVLSADILMQVRRLRNDRRRSGYIASLVRTYKANKYAKTLIEQRTKPGIKVGDFVSAQGELAEVIKVMKGKYGFRSFRLKFLLREDEEVAGTGPNKTVWKHQNPEFEEFPAMFIRKIYSREDVLKKLRREILKHDPTADVGTKQLTPNIRGVVIHFWKNVGLKESLRGDTVGARKKIEKEIKKVSQEINKPVLGS